MSNIDIIDAALPRLRDAILNTPIAKVIGQQVQESHAGARHGLAAELDTCKAVVDWTKRHKDAVARLFRRTVDEATQLPTGAVLYIRLGRERNATIQEQFVYEHNPVDDILSDMLLVLGQCFDTSVLHAADTFSHDYQLDSDLYPRISPKARFYSMKYGREEYRSILTLLSALSLVDYSLGLESLKLVADIELFRTTTNRLRYLRKKLGRLIQHGNTMDQIIYQPLDHALDRIRLVEIVENASGQISGILKTYDTSSCPPFHAVSYQWALGYGSDQPFKEILINHRALWVSKNLHSFLLAYRSWKRENGRTSEVDHIWADQISIDQHDTEERNYQVGLMGPIFSQAQEVLAWLGPDDRILTSLKNTSYRYLDSGWTSRTTELLESKFWQRLWIQQEIVLAKDVIFMAGGTHRCAAGLRKNEELRSRNSEPALAMLLDDGAKRIRELSLIEAITAFSGKACSDIRDKVYGLQGIVRSTEKVPVDYTLEPEQVYAQAARVILAQLREDTPAHLLHARMNALLTLGLRMNIPIGKARTICEDILEEVKTDELTALRRSTTSSVGSNKAREADPSLATEIFELLKHPIHDA